MDDLNFEPAFLNLCHAWADQIGSLETTEQKEKHGVSVSLLRRVVRLELLYLRASFGDVRNVLYCRVYPVKTVKTYYLLPELFLELAVKEFRSCFFAEIGSEDQMRSCFFELTRRIEDYLPLIEAAAEQGRIPLQREDAQTDYPEQSLIFAKDPSFRDRFVIYNYTLHPAYQALLGGDRKKAVRLLEKAKRKGRTYAYQDQLSDYLKTCDESFSPMPDACNAVKAEQELTKRALPIYIASIACVYLAFSAFFWLLGRVFLLLFTRSCAACLSSPWYDAFLLAGLPTLFGFFAFRKPLAALVSRKTGTRLNKLDRMKNSPALDRFTAVLFAAALGFSLYAFVQIGCSAVRIYPDRLDSVSEQSILRRNEIRFEDVEAIYHVSARYNVYGDRVERSSYLIVTKDGRVLDLDGFASEKDCETVLFPLLSPYQIPVKEIDSARDLD